MHKFIKHGFCWHSKDIHFHWWKERKDNPKLGELGVQIDVYTLMDKVYSSDESDGASSCNNYFES